MPVSTPLLRKRMDFFEQHSVEEMWKAKVAVRTAREEWDEYLEIHPHAHGKAPHTLARLKQANARFESLKNQFGDMGISHVDDLGELGGDFEDARSKVESDRIEKNLFSQLSPRSLAEINSQIKSNRLLTHADKQSLCQKTEQFLRDLSLRSYDYDIAKKLDLYQRKAKLRILLDSGVDISQVYDSIERRLFAETYLTRLQPKNLGIPAMESLRVQLERLKQQIGRDYDDRYQLRVMLLQDAQVVHDKTLQKLELDARLEPILNRARLVLGYKNLVRLSESESQKLFETLCFEVSEIGPEALDLIKTIYEQTKTDIQFTKDLEASVLGSWNFSRLVKLPKNQVETELREMLETIARRCSYAPEVLRYLHGWVTEVAQKAITEINLQRFLLDAWSLKTVSAREKALKSFKDSIPLIAGKNRIERRLELLFKYNEAEIQLFKMKETLNKLEQSSLDAWQEMKIDLSFQEAEIQLGKMGFLDYQKTVCKRTHKVILEYRSLKRKHAFILAENCIIRAAVEKLDSLKLLSFEAQERAVVWIAYKWCRVLRVTQLLSMLDVKPLSLNLTGNLNLNSIEYDLSPFHVMLVQSYIAEALNQLQLTQNQSGMLYPNIRAELLSVQQQICDCLPSGGEVVASL